MTPTVVQSEGMLTGDEAVRNIAAWMESTRAQPRKALCLRYRLVLPSVRVRTVYRMPRCHRSPRRAYSASARCRHREKQKPRIAEGQ